VKLSLKNKRVLSKLKISSIFLLLTQTYIHQFTYKRMICSLFFNYSLLIQLPIRYDVVPMRILVPELSYALSMSEPKFLRYRNHSLLFLPFPFQLKTCMTVMLLLPDPHLFLPWALVKCWILSQRMIDSCDPMGMTRGNLTLHSFD
jgi:hypothetical protein